MPSFEDILKKKEKKYPSKLEVERFPSRSYAFNKLLSKPEDDIHGIPVGVFIGLWGEKGVGKTHIALEICRAFCENDRPAVYLDFENAVKRGLVDGLGLSQYEGNQFKVHNNISTVHDLEDLLHSSVGSGSGYIEADDASLVVVDSLANVIPDEMMEKSVSDLGVGLTARTHSNLLKKYTGLASDNDTTLVFVQQQRDDVSASMATGYDIKTSAGGNTLDHLCDVFFRMKKKAIVEKDDGSIDYAEVQFEVEKNKTAPIQPSVEVPIRYGKGFDRDLILYNLLNENKHDLECFEISGSWKKLHLPSGDYKKQSKQAFEKEVIQENREEIENILKKKGLI